MVQLVPIVVLALFSGMAAAGDTPPAGSVISSGAADPSGTLPATPAGSGPECVTCAAMDADGGQSPTGPALPWREGPERRRTMPR